MTYNIPTRKHGDMWPGIPLINIERPAGTPMDLTGALIRMQFKKNKTLQNFGLELSTLNGGIVILGAGQISIPKRITTLLPGTWYYDIEIIPANGDTITVLEGEWTITQDVTR